jgi:hypothetical protein
MSATLDGAGTLAIAAVTSVLREVLGARLAADGVAALLGDVSISALPPDRVTLGAEERPQINLFLYRVAPNTRWRGANGGANGSPPRLALDLHYLVTAYGEGDLHADILLGMAIVALQEAATLPAERARAILAGSARNAAAGTRAAVAAGAVLDNLDMLEIVPEFPAMEEMSRLWSALQARYRPSLTYRVSTASFGPLRTEPRP